MLSGLKVLDLSRVLAGPLCSMMLADLGAHVIKVERPGQGDESRGWGPPFDPEGRSAYFLSINRNKKSIALELTNPEDIAVLRSLLLDADVVLDNFREGALHKYGLSPNEWLARRSKLLWCSISGFGAGSARPGYDFVVQAEQGWMSVTGAADGVPMKVGLPLVDITAGKDAAIAILAALAAVRVSELPADRRRITISLAASAAAALINVAQNVLVSGAGASRYGNAHPNLVPYQLFETASVAIVLAVGNDAQWRALLQASDGLLASLDGDDLATNAGRIQQRERVVSTIAQQFLEHSAEFWTERLDAYGVPCGVVRTVQQVLDGSDASAEMGMPSSVGGSMRYPPPLLDADGAEIRREGWRVF